MSEREIQAALERHWAASQAGDPVAEHAIYHEDAVLDYPQSGERICGRRNIQGSRAEHPAKRTFTLRRIVGSGDLWVTEYIVTYDGRPTETVSIMEFRDGKVERERQYFADPFRAPEWRAKWASGCAEPERIRVRVADPA
jgi:ketosteroid isomerase-like protein